ncbi:MAG TPA: hypothetical protein VJ732_12315 [Bryobacteraceae bacterium]|nr:hypothetical protein [Bryobacteraceae bacterium]
MGVLPEKFNVITPGLERGVELPEAGGRFSVKGMLSCANSAVELLGLKATVVVKDWPGKRVTGNGPEPPTEKSGLPRIEGVAAIVAEFVP